MRKILILTLSFFLLSPSIAGAEEFTADSRISTVTVYSNRAAVTRTATVKLPKGAHTVVFKNLPAQITEDSLRVEGSAVADVTLGALAHKTVVTQELSSDRERIISNRIKNLADQIAFENAEISALSDRMRLLQVINEHGLRQTNEEVKIFTLQTQQWLQAAKKMQTEISGIKKRQQSHDINIRTLNEAVQQAKTELAQLRTGSRRNYQVTVPLEAAAATELTLELTYQVNNASWQPLYDARLQTETGALTLVQYGTVRQLTGEDWEKVSIILSTAQPHRNASPPVLNPVWVNSFKPSDGKDMSMSFARGVAQEEAVNTDPLQEWRRSAEARRFEIDFNNDPTATAPKQARFAAAQIDTGGFVAEYRVAGPATILSDNNETKLMVGAFDVDSALEVHVQPQHTTEAFLVARGKLKGEATVLPGQVNLFRDGAFIGKTRFPLLRPGEEHNLFFGVDDQISVKRNMVKDERKEGGMIIKDSILERRYVTEVRNLRQSPAEIRLRETIPVSKDESIKVEIVKDATTGGYASDIDKIAGLTGWSFRLAPQEKKDIRLGWKVTWPAGDTVRGLP